MIAFERRQRLLQLLYEQPGLRVSELAKRTGVTEATVRSDLRALEGEQKLRRVHGGAVLSEATRTACAAAAASYASLSTGPQPADPHGMGRWAAEMVQDGDALFLDESAWALAMAPGLSRRRDLTVLTNNVDAARRLAAATSHRVLLVGGLLYDGGAYTGDGAMASLPRDVPCRLAFVAGAGFTTDKGVTGGGPALALKRAAVDRAEQVVAWVDSQALGKNGDDVIAPPGRVCCLVTDKGISPAQVEALRAANLSVTVCSAGSVTTHSPSSKRPVHRIGFANLSEERLFSVEVRRGLERAAKQRANVDLLIADNRLSGARALEVADALLEQGVDLVIEYQIDAGVGALLMNRYQRANVPVIAVDIPMVGAIYFGVNNVHSGQLAGRALGHWVQQEWNGTLDALFLLEEPRAGPLPGGRMQGQVQGLEEVLGPIPATRRVRLKGGTSTPASEAAVRRALADRRNDRQIGVVCFTDDAALGALRAARALGREEHVAVVGQGADSAARAEIARPGSRLIGCTAFLPEQYGERLLELALRILHGESVPPAVYMGHVFIDRAAIAANALQDETTARAPAGVPAVAW